MAYNTKPIKTDKDGNPISQYYNPETDEYEPVEGAGGGNKVILYNEDGTPNDSLSLGEILDKLDQLTGTVIDEETRKQNEQTRQQNEQQRTDLYNALKDLDVSQYELRLQKLEHDTSVEETVVEEAYGPVIPLPENVVNGQINEIKIFGNTEAEEDNVKSTIAAMKIKSVGKNLIDISKTSKKILDGYYYPADYVISDNTITIISDTGFKGVKIPITLKLYTKYTLSLERTNTTRVFVKPRLGTQNIDAIVGGKISNYFTFETVEYTDYWIILDNGDYVGENILSNIQLEEGDIATDYEPYQESVAYITAKDESGNILELRSLPNGTKDEINVAERKLIKRIGEKANVSSGTVINYTDMAEGGTYYAWNDNGETETGTKGDTLGIDATTLIYQLAEPEIIPVQITGSLQAYENGTMYIDAIIPRIDFYDINGIAVDVPIGTIDTLYKVDKETGYLYSLDISQAEISQDRLSFIHPDLVEGDLVDWDYIPDVEGTNPTILMKLPTNLKASVTSTLQGVQELSNKTKNLDTRVIANRRDIETLNESLFSHEESVDTKLLLKADKDYRYPTSHQSRQSSR